MQTFADDLLSKRVAVITGGGTGLGFAIARMFGTLGARVVVTSRSRDHVDPAVERLLAEGIEAHGLLADVRDPNLVQTMVDTTIERLGGVDILVNNAAGNFLVRAERLSPNGWAAVRSIVLDGTFHCSRAVFPVMKEQGSGVILNIVATYADGPAPFTVHSGAAKAGVLSLTRTLAVEWAGHGIRVNAIAPGPVQTEGASSALWESDEARARMQRSVPMGRFGLADEIAAMATFLASDAAGYVTGGCFPVDGGLTLGPGLFDARFVDGGV